jgi:hypothetical protein
MAEPTISPSYDGRTLIVILSMHRSGSSLVANLLQRLGTSLGPFHLLGANEDNKYGHFEAEPIRRVNRKLLVQVYGTEEAVPASPDLLRRFCARDGRWRLDELPKAEKLVEEGRNLIQPLITSGQVSGFKDPPVPLLWPFWEEVFRGFPGLRVVPLILLRSPHEIAMSIFTRGKGRCSYQDALDVTAVTLWRLQEIRHRWAGEQVLVRFDPRVFAEDLRSAAKTCHLAWHDEVFRQVYDPVERHQTPARIDHDAQRVFDEMSGLPPGLDVPNALTLARDGAIREGVIHQYVAMRLAESQKRTAALEQRVHELAAALDIVENHLQELRLRRQAARALAHTIPAPVRDWLQQSNAVQLFYGKIRG